MRSIGSPYMDKGKRRAFLKNPSQKKTVELLNPEQIPAKHVDKVADSTLSFARTSI
jgi:hypothetical protein